MRDLSFIVRLKEEGAAVAVGTDVDHAVERRLQVVVGDAREHVSDVDDEGVGHGLDRPELVSH